MVSLHSNSKVTKIPDQRVSEFIQFQVQLGAGNPKQSFIVETQQCAMLCKSLDSNSPLLMGPSQRVCLFRIIASNRTLETSVKSTA